MREKPARGHGAAGIIYPAAIFVVCIALWEAGARDALLPAYVLPAPSLIAERMVATAGLMVWHSLITSNEIFWGFLLAVVVGVMLAGLIAYVKRIEQALYPWLVVIQVVPKVALGPLLVVWLGVGFLPKVLVAFLLAFFPIMIDTLIGLRSVQQDCVFLLQSMGANDIKRFWYFQLPNALPYMFSSFKVAITLAVVGAIVGEFIGADAGLGYVLIAATGTLDTVLMFVALVWISLIAVLFYAAVSWLETLCISWHSSQRYRKIGATA